MKTPKVLRLSPEEQLAIERLSEATAEKKLSLMHESLLKHALQDPNASIDLRGFAMLTACLHYSLACGIVTMTEAEECERWLKHRTQDDRGEALRWLRSGAQMVLDLGSDASNAEIIEAAARARNAEIKVDSMKKRINRLIEQRDEALRRLGEAP